MSGKGREGMEVKIEELGAGMVEEWTDGSRMEGRAAGATRMEGLYLGTVATVADAEEVGVSIAWERALRHGDAGQLRGNMADIWANVPPPSIVDRRETGGADGRETETVGVGTRTSG